MDRYRVDGLISMDAAAFEAAVRRYLSLTDAGMEGFGDGSTQRDLSVRFHWGHDHDFGTFRLDGLMGDRHLTLLARFIDRFHALPQVLDGIRVLDIGCWTGGSSLLLAAMGARVVAIEEVRKYVDCLTMLVDAFGLSDAIEPRAMSLYDCTEPALQDAFDIVLFAGVLYHVTDPVLALRITFDVLRDDGVCLVETATMSSKRRVLGYHGPRAVGRGRVQDFSRQGWNWLVPSISALTQMLQDVGYRDIRAEAAAGSRAFAVARRARHVDMLRAGLSARDVR
jgi:2-polyprenyl-3-methyl-5-hydroxy-6-metoxy-1,4-benzoquinol methylase